jgi:hypothetical protein
MFYSFPLFSQEMIYGVTIDDISDLNSTVVSLANHSRKMTARIVFDEWLPASVYKDAIRRIDSVSFTMGEILDSYYMKEYNTIQFSSRVEEYQEAFKNEIDIWEVGNEINGDWLGPTDTVMAKVRYALRVSHEKGLKTAVTFYYNKDCIEKPENEMFRWINENFEQDLRLLPDYIFVSYYEDDCNNLQPEWQKIFDSLKVIFPSSKLGIGECGTEIVTKKRDFMKRYYSMNVTTPGYVGGYFWWYYKKDCIPFNNKPLWKVLDSSLK